MTYPNGRRIEYTYHSGGAVKDIADDGEEDNPIATYETIGNRVLVRAMQKAVSRDLRDGFEWGERRHSQTD